MPKFVNRPTLTKALYTVATIVPDFGDCSRRFPVKKEDFKSRTSSNPGQDPEIKDCPGKSRTDGQLTQPTS